MSFKEGDLVYGRLSRLNEPIKFVCGVYVGRQNGFFHTHLINSNGDIFGACEEDIKLVATIEKTSLFGKIVEFVLDRMKNCHRMV